MSDLEKILNDDLPKCEIVESVENAARRVDLIKWTSDAVYFPLPTYARTPESLKYQKFHIRKNLKRTSSSTKPIGAPLFLPKNPHYYVGNHYKPIK